MSILPRLLYFFSSTCFFLIPLFFSRRHYCVSHHHFPLQVFGITLNPFIVYTSNIFAIISLRAFYSFIAVFMDQLRFLDKAVALVLGFIGLKMVVDYFAAGAVPTWAALLVVGGVLGAGACNQHRIILLIFDSCCW